jgi:SAM-dependent methyltransferase
MTFDPTWETIHSTREWARDAEYWLLDVVRRRFDGQVTVRAAGVRVLDLGCGGGALSLPLAAAGLEVHALDGSESAVELTRRRMAEAGLHADARVLDAGRILETYGPESMDWVIDNACLQCCAPEDQRAIVAQIGQVLRPGGWVYSRLASVGSWGEGLGTPLPNGRYRDIPEGPAAGMGAITFLSRDDVMALWGWLDLCGNRITQDHRAVREGTYSEPAERDGTRPQATGARHWWLEWVVEGRKP